MSRATQTALIQDDRTVYEAAAGTAVGLSGVTFAVGLAALLGLVAIDPRCWSRVVGGVRCTATRPRDVGSGLRGRLTIRVR